MPERVQLELLKRNAMKLAGNSPVAVFFNALAQHGLLDQQQLQQLAAKASTYPDPKAMATDLVRSGRLTAFQAKLLLQGRGGELLLGPYVIVDLLGEGGMGQVFKAKHQKMNRVVALKLIRKERTQNQTALRRFQREIQAAAKLNHPNVVRAFDADDVNGQMTLTMEFVDGSDLAKIVKEKGPLPVVTACDYIRQTALGLQHAHEQGLVHRDIKPQNLLLSKTGVVKILDMGLARRTEQSEDTTTLTQEGTVMGTADYLAPEQAMSSHTVDIRADVYSLGAAFYFLLAGRVPFPGGTLTEKLIKCQLQEPEPLEKLRPELPPQIVTVLRKMMAKKPEDRYQTPAEVAAALATVPQVKGKAVVPPAVAAANTDTPEAIHTQADKPNKRRNKFILVGGLSFATAILLGIVLLMRSGTKDSPPAVAPTPASEQITYLSDLQEEVDLNRTGRMFSKHNKSRYWDGRVVEEKVPFKGVDAKNLVTHPGGDIVVRYTLDGDYRWFVSEVGTPDTMLKDPDQPLHFSVYGDGKLLWKSTPIAKRKETDAFKVSVKGVKALELKVECGSTIRPWATWGQPRLIK